MEKLWRTPEDTAKIIGVQTSAIRCWEDTFGKLHSKRAWSTRNRYGDRRFSPADILRLKVIKALLTVKKYTLEGAKKELIELDLL